MSHEKGIEAATEIISAEHAYQLSYEAVSKGIKAYLDASGMVMVPREATPADIWQAAMRYWHDAGLSPYLDKEALMRTAHWWHDAWVNSQPNPFQTPEESREKK